MTSELMAQANKYKPKISRLWVNYKTAKRTLDVLIEHCDDDGETFIGIKTIAERLLCSNQTVMNHFEMLKEIGVLKIEKIGRKSIKYIAFEGSNEGSTQSSTQSSSEGSSESSTEGSSGLEAKEGKEDKEGKGSEKSSPPTPTSTKKKRETQKQLSVRILKEYLDKNPDLKEDDCAESRKILKQFLDYRVEMYETTRLVKYQLKSVRALSGFVNQLDILADANYNIYEAIQKMEDKEWASINVDWILKK
jgi:AraC-like DNA-binding protein